MRILIFEWLNGGGHWGGQTPPAFQNAMVRQGMAMLQALVEDFAQFANRIVVPIDSRIGRIGEEVFPTNLPTFNSDSIQSTIETVCVDSQESLVSTLQSMAAEVDYVLLIAPESGGCLVQCCQWLEEWAEKLVSPDLRFVTLASNKQDTADWLEQRGVPVPRGSRLSDWEAASSLKLPVILKPIDGAGSEHVRVVENWASFAQLDDPGQPDDPENWRVEEFVGGVSVSVSAICRGDEFELLAPTGQVFETGQTNDCVGHYTGAKFPLDELIAARATKLAREAIKALPPTRGYVGIDIVISDSGSEHDCVIEVNPRLTMSYLRLRTIHDGNLAAKMIKGGI